MRRLAIGIISTEKITQVPPKSSVYKGIIVAWFGISMIIPSDLFEGSTL